MTKNGAIQMNEIEITPKQIAKAINDLLNENEKLNKMLNEANNKNLQLIEEINQLEDARYSLDRVELEKRIGNAITYMETCNELIVPDANIKLLVLKEEYKKIIKMLKGDD